MKFVMTLFLVVSITNLFAQSWRSANALSEQIEKHGTPDDIYGGKKLLVKGGAIYMSDDLIIVETRDEKRFPLYRKGDSLVLTDESFFEGEKVARTVQIEGIIRNTINSPLYRQESLFWQEKDSIAGVVHEICEFMKTVSRETCTTSAGYYVYDFFPLNNTKVVLYEKGTTVSLVVNKLFYIFDISRPAREGQVRNPLCHSCVSRHPNVQELQDIRDLFLAEKGR